MIIVKPKHALKLPIDLWSRYARVVVCEDHTKCIEPGRVVLLDDNEPVNKPPNVVFVDINKPCINIGSGNVQRDRSHEYLCRSNQEITNNVLISSVQNRPKFNRFVNCLV